MSDLILPRRPAYSSLNVRQPKYLPLAIDDVRRVQLSVIGCGDFYCRAGSSKSLSGYYIHRDGIGTSFLKVVTSGHMERQLASDRLAKWISRCGVETSLIKSGFPKMIGTKYAVFAYPYLEARFAEPKLEDMVLIGQSLGRLHRALFLAPSQESIRANSDLRIKKLKTRSKYIASGLQRFGHNDEKIREIIQNEMGFIDTLNCDENCQAIHGDLVYANIIFPLASESPIIIDFEDTLTSWMPIDLDIAVVLERFILTQANNMADRFKLGKSLLVAYASTIRKKRFLSYRLDKCLRFLAARSLATLAEMKANNLPINKNEWDKFIYLYENAKLNVGLLNNLEEEFRL